MRTFDHPNTSHGWKCPICKTDNDEPVVLIGINGTQKGSIIEAEQFHLRCIELLYYKEEGILAQKLDI